MALLEADARPAVKFLEKVEERLRQAPQAAAAPFGEYLRGRTAETFAALAGGGLFRGVSWAPRVASRRGGGADSRPLLVDTGRLRAAATGAAPRLAGTAIAFGVDLPYARAVAARRPFLFFEEGTDALRLSQIMLKDEG